MSSTSPRFGWMRARLLTFVLMTTIGIIMVSATLSFATELPCEGYAQTSTHPGKKKSPSRLKTYTSKFWDLIESRATKYPAELKPKGIVIGDFHFNNVDVVFDRAITNRAHIEVVDLDDAGENYLIGDFLKYLALLVTLHPNLDLTNVMAAYVDGLKLDSIDNLAPVPHRVLKLLRRTAIDFEEDRLNYVHKKRSEGMAFKPSELTADEKATFAAFKRHPIFSSPFRSTLEWVQVNDKGSSAGQVRYLFYGSRLEDESEGVIEFKELACSATGSRVSQDIGTMRKKVVNLLLPALGLTPQSSLLGRQSVVTYNGQSYLLREKIPDQMNNLKIEKMDREDLQVYAEYFAKLLGYLHSKSMGSSEQRTYGAAVLRQGSFLTQEARSLAAEFQ